MRYLVLKAGARRRYFGGCLANYQSILVEVAVEVNDECQKLMLRGSIVLVLTT